MNGVDCGLNDGLPSDFDDDVTITKDLVHYTTSCQVPKLPVCSGVTRVGDTRGGN